MDYNPDHGEPSPYEPVSRRGHPGIIRPIVDEEIHPFRDSPVSLALLDALLPGGYLHDGVTTLAQHSRITILDLHLEMRVGGHHTVVVLASRLPSSSAPHSWTRHSPSEYEHRRIQFRFERPEDQVYETTCTVGSSVLETDAHGGNVSTWTLGPVISATGGRGAGTWALSCDHPFWTSPGHPNPPRQQIKVRDLCISCDARDTLRFSNQNADLCAWSFNTHLPSCPSAKKVPSPQPLDLMVCITKFLRDPKNAAGLARLSIVKKALESITLKSTIKGLFDFRGFVQNHSTPMVCFKMGITTSFTVGLLYAVGTRPGGRNTQATIRSWNSSPFSNPGDSGALTFGIKDGNIYALAIHQLGPTYAVVGKVAAGTTVVSALDYARTALGRGYTLSFDQSKTCVLSKPSPSIFSAMGSKKTTGGGTTSRSTAKATAAPAQTSPVSARGKMVPAKKSGKK